MNKRIPVIGAVIILIALAFVYFNPGQIGGTGSEAILGNTAIMSLSDVTFDDSIQELGGKQGWIMTLTQIPRGVDYAKLLYTTLSDSGTTATEQVQLETSLDYQQCRWTVQGDRDKQIKEMNNLGYGTGLKIPLGLTNIYDSTWGCYWQNQNVDDWADSVCGSGSTRLAHQVGGSGNCVRMCYSTQTKGLASNVLDGAVKSQTSLIFSTTEGEKAVATLTDDDSTSKILYGSKTVGHAQLLGNLWSGKTCDGKVERDELMAYTPLTFYNQFLPTQAMPWIPIERADYNTYRSLYIDLRDDMEDCQNKVDEFSCYEKVKSEFNSAAQATQTTEPFYIYGDNTAINDRVEYASNKGYFYADINDVIAYPVTRMYLAADFIEIGMFSSTPEILSTESSCFQSREEGKISVEVKNIGNTKGNFEVKSDCPSPFGEDSTQTGLLSPGASTVVVLDISGGTISTDKLERECKIIVEDLGLGGKTDTAMVDVCLERVTTCSQGETRCSGNTVQICRTGGYEDFMTCDYKCESGKCVDEPSCKGDSCSGVATSHNDVWIFVVTLAILGFLMGWKFIGADSNHAKVPFYKEPRFIAAIIVALILALIGYFIYPTVAGIVSAIVPNFNCGDWDILCWFINIIKLIIFLVVVIIVSKFI